MRAQSGEPEPSPSTGEPARPDSAQFTFLFTDIEASTRAWERDPGAMSLLLAAHDEILQGAVKAAGGRVFKHTGDGICAAFPTALAAVGAAVTAQRALQHGNGRAEGLRVRMALHSGVAECRAGDHFGPALNRTARLLEVAHGGQIVASLVTAELVRDDLPPAAGLLDLGEHRLADLARPERVFQVTDPALSSSFPPLRSLGSHRHNLPFVASSFIGREGELSAVTDLLDNARLLTLCGVGGVGKTRLGLQLAASRLGAFPDGVFMVELAALADPSLLISEVARTLGLVDAGDAALDALERLCLHLRPRRMLLVLDNCEHLVDAAAALGEAVLRRCPGVVVLATSREPLAVAGEVVWRVPPLGLPADDGEPGSVAVSDAATLFCERARAADPDFTLTPESAAAVGRICRRLDGIPLALELAAARVAVLSPAQIAQRLDDRFHVLTAGPRTASARQQTLRATMDWSYELLTDAERVALQRLAIFPASFDLDAAEAVAADGATLVAADVLNVLARLVDKSLVVAGGRGGDTRYRLLETVRSYGAEKLAASGTEEVARRAHRDHFLASVQDFWDDSVGEGWIASGQREYENWRAALDWSLRQGETEAVARLVIPLGWSLTNQGLLAEGRARLERALALTGPGTEHLRGMFLNVLGFALSLQGDLAGSRACHEEAWAIAGERGPMDRGMAGWFLALRLLHDGEIDRAEDVITAARQGFSAVGSLLGIGWCEFTLGWIRFARGEDGRRHFEAALDLGRRTGGQLLMAHAISALAPLVALAGEADAAVALAAEGVQVARHLLLSTLVMGLTRSAEVDILLGRRANAAAALTELLGVLRDTGAQAFLADSLEMVALLREADGAAAAAARLFGAAEGVRAAVGESPDQRSISPALDRCRARLRSSLPGVAERWAEGERMSPQAAIDDARQELEAAAGRRSPPGRPSPRPVPVVSASLARDGDRWRLRYGDASFELPDMKGLGYLARLLAEPGREFHVLDLAGAGGVGGVARGDAGPALDERAKAEYRGRIRDLQGEIDEAQSWNDPERAARAQHELDVLTGQLAAAVGLGGRDRPAASAAERARVSVRKAIANAIARIVAHDADLGLLLSTTVRTGTWCRYTPDPRLPVAWTL